MPDPISPRSLKLLQSYFDARCDIFLLAQRERLPVLDLIRWSQSPAVQSHIAALKRLTDDSIHLRTAQARLLSLDTLENIVKTTDDPHELRRAASVIYRGGATMPQPRFKQRFDSSSSTSDRPTVRSAGTPRPRTPASVTRAPRRSTSRTPDISPPSVRPGHNRTRGNAPARASGASSNESPMGASAPQPPATAAPPARRSSFGPRIQGSGIATSTADAAPRRTPAHPKVPSRSRAPPAPP